MTRSLVLTSRICDFLFRLLLYDKIDITSANPQRPINTYEPEPREESVETSEPELTTSERRYPLKERRAPTTNASQYALLTDEGEPECYYEAIGDEHKEKWLSRNAR